MATFAEVPDTFPSVIRQPVRNGYPVLACMELGARHISVADSDVADPARAERLQVLRDEGASVIARVLWALGRAPSLPAPGAPVDEIELVLLGRGTPTSAELAALDNDERALIFSTLMRKPRGTAELPRWRYGLHLDEAAQLDAVLVAGGRRGRALLDGTGTDPESVKARAQAWTALVGCDLIVPAGGSAGSDPGRIADAFLRSCAAGVGRFFVDGLSELDRTLDTSSGLLDRAWNPRPAFHTAVAQLAPPRIRPARHHTGRGRVPDPDRPVERDSPHLRRTTTATRTGLWRPHRSGR